MCTHADLTLDCEPTSVVCARAVIVPQCALCRDKVP